MTPDDKALLAEAKKALSLKTNKQIALAIGDQESNAINWSNRGIYLYH